MSLTPAQLSALVQAERGKLAQAKAGARVILDVDREQPRSAAQLSEELKRHGLSLRPDTINRLRYVGRLLKALDPQDLDPPELAGFTSIEVLYKVQRAAELTHQGPRDVLELLEREQPASVSDYLQDMIRTRSSRPSEAAKETWRSPLPKVPASVADNLNKAFGQYAKARDITPMQAAEELAADLEGRSDLNRAFRQWRWRMGFEAKQAAGALVHLLDHMTPEQWRRLLDAAGAPLGEE